MIISLSVEANAQNAIVGSGFSSGWGGGGCPTGNSNFNFLAAGAGTTYILTTTANGTGNQYWRYGIDWGGTTAQWMATGGSPDLSVSPSTTYSLNTSCTTSGALYYNVPNTSYNYVFKTLDASSSPTGTVVFFEVQGAVQTISSVAQSPTSANVFPGQSVLVTATTSGTSTGQNFYLRYSDDAMSTSTVLSMAGSGTSYTATIPASVNTASKNVEYYVFSSGPSNVAADGSNADLYTINLNNNGGPNYSYAVASGWTTTADGNWSTAGTWTANAVPSSTESMGAVSILHDVTVNQNATISSISVNSAKILTISSGSTITTTGASSIDGTITNAGTMAVSGGSWTFTGTGRYKHNIDGGTIPSTTWNSGSTCEIIGVTAATSITGINQSFHHFIWNCTSQTSNMQLAGTVPTINGDFTITTSGSGTLRLANSQSPTLTVSGNFSIAAGELDLATSTGSPILTIIGNYTQTGGTVNLAPSGSTNLKTLNVAGDFSISTPGQLFNTTGIGKLIFNKTSGNQNFTSYSTGLSNNTTIIEIGNGTTKNPTLVLNSDMRVKSSSTITVFSGSTLSFGTYAITEVSATATFTANSGSILKIGSTAGITSSGATGNVQTTTRTFDVGANYVYSGSANQATGNGLPASINTLTIENSGGGGNNTVTLTNSGTLTITGTSNSLVLTSGLFSVGSANIISIPSSGTVTSGGGDFASGSAAGTTTFAGTGTVSGTVNFYNVNISNGVNFGAGSTVNGTLTINSGGWVDTNAPTYGSSSTLKYNTGAAFSTGSEWGTAASGQGVPYNVRIATNSTALTFTGGSARTAQGNITIDANTSLTLSATSGGDLILKGDWTNNGTFDPNTRAVTLGGSSLQTINSATTFDYLIMSNSSGGGVNLDASIIIDNNLNFTQGVINLGVYNLTITSGGTITGYTSARFVNTSSSGYLIMTVGGSDVTFPVGPAVSIYCPVTLNNPNTSDDFSVNTSITVTNATYNDTRRVNLQWKIVEAVAGSSASTVKLQWPNTRHAASFNPAGTVQIGVWNGTTYDATASTVSGSNPYLATSTATISTFNAANPYVVANDDAFAPYYYTTQDGDWNTSSTWTCSCVPASNTNVVINHAVTVNAAVANPATTVTISASKSITFGASGTLTTTTLTIDGSLIMSSGGTFTIANTGTFTNNSVFTSGSGKIAFAGSATVSGTNSFYNADISGAVDFGANSTVTGTLTILSGGSVNTNAPTYGSSSTLVYSTGGAYSTGSEWGTAASGQGVPFNVRISTNSTALSFTGASARTAQGDITIDASTTLTLSATSGGDLYIKGDISKEGTFNPNSRAVDFNGTGTQTITVVGGGEIAFDYLIIDKSSGNLTLSSSPATNIRTNATSSDVLILTNGSIDLNGQQLTIAGQGGNIRIDNSAKTITGSAGSKILITGNPATTSKTVTQVSSGSLITDINVTLQVQSGCVDFGNGLTTVNGTMEILTQGCATGNATVFGTSSYLVYNTGGVYERKIEWNDGSLQNVTVKSGCTVDMDDTPAQVKTMAGNLLIEDGGTMKMYSRSSTVTVSGNVTINSTGTLDMDDMTTALIINGNIVITGTLDMSTQIGGDIEIKGNWTKTGTFTSQNRMVTFNSTSNQYIYSSTTFGYLKINNSGGAEVILNANIALENTCTGSVESGAIFNLGTYTITDGGSATFENKSGGTIKIGSLVGITSSGATGNVQTGTRTFNGAGIYHYIGAANQVSGNGLPTPILSGGKVIVETNAISTTFAASQTTRFNSGATFEIRQGTVNDNGTNFFAAAGDAANTGNLTMSGGLYQFNDNLTLGSALRYPRLSETYTLTGGVIELAATLASTQYQHLRGGKTYYKVKISGGSVADGFKRISSAITITNNLEITGATTIFDIESNGMDGDAGLTMDNGRLRMSKLNTSLPELTGTNTAYSITGGTIEFYGTNATQQQLIRGNFNTPSPTKISYYNIELNSSAANVSTPAGAGNVDLSESFGIQNSLIVNSPTVFRMDASDNIDGTGDFTLTSGSTLLYGSTNGIKTSGTGVSDGNIRISGTRTFPTDASYGFVSPGNMDVGNALPSTVQNLYVYKTATTGQATLQQTTNVSTTLFLTSGIINTSTYKVIVLNNDATNGISGGSASSFVNGNLQRAITSNTNTYSFPVGDGTATTNYKRADFVNNNLVNLTALDVSVSAISESGNDIDENIIAEQDGTLLNKLMEAAVWTFEPQAGWSAGGSYGVNLYVANTGLAGSDDNKFCTVKRDNGSSDYAEWSTFEGSTTIPAQDAAGRVYNSGNGYAQRTGYIAFSKHAIAKSDAVLPIELLSFDAVYKGDFVEISWATATEINNDYFIVEKSMDGINFEPLVQVDGAKNSNYIINYSTEDNSPFKDLTYYRLKQTDFDGKYTYSNIVSVNIADNELLQGVWFNKENQELNIEFNYRSSSNFTICIYDLCGKQLINKSAYIDGKLNYKINLKMLPSGIYTVSISSNTDKFIKKVITY